MTGDPYTDALAALAAVVDLGGRATPRQVTARLTRAVRESALRRRTVEPGEVVAAMGAAVARGWLDVAHDAERGSVHTVTAEGHRNAGALHMFFRRPRRKAADADAAPAKKPPPTKARARARAQLPMVECACGCGAMRRQVDSDGRDRAYIKGHHPKPSPLRDLALELMQAGPITAEDLRAARGLSSPVGARECLGRMMRAGQVVRVSRGIYALPGTDASGAKHPGFGRGAGEKRRGILRAVERGAETVAEIAAVVGGTHKAVSNLAYKLVAAGELMRIGRGRYALPNAGEGAA